MDKYAIIVAGGKGLRMGGDIPKQFMLVGGKPVLFHTIEAFYHCDSSIRIILVLPQEQIEYWNRLCRDFDVPSVYALVAGGETRFHSVRNGLAAITATEEALVAVHDGVRPFVTKSVIKSCFEQTESLGAVVPVIDVVESVRSIDATGQSHSEDRSKYKLVQTPQTFRLSLLRKAYAQTYQPVFTDDASVVEASGQQVCLVPGNRENIKLTTPFDLRIAEVLLLDR